MKAQYEQNPRRRLSFSFFLKIEQPIYALSPVSGLPHYSFESFIASTMAAMNPANNSHPGGTAAMINAKGDYNIVARLGSGCDLGGAYRLWLGRLSETQRDQETERWTTWRCYGWNVCEGHNERGATRRVLNMRSLHCGRAGSASFFFMSASSFAGKVLPRSQIWTRFSILD